MGQIQEIPTKLNILFLGAGAIGSYIGASLSAAGQSTTFVERPEVIQQLQKNGLHLQLPGRTIHIPEPRIKSSVAEALSDESFDLLVFSLKSFDTLTAVESLAGLNSRLPAVLCLQNGVDNEGMIAGIIGWENVIAGTVTSAIGRKEDGTIVLERLRGIGIADNHPLSARIVEVFSHAGLNASLYSKVSAMKWSKMLTNLLANASSAILGMTPDEIFSNPGLYRIEIGQLREALAVMQAHDIHVVDLPATPVRLLATGVHWLPLSFSRPLLHRAVGGGRGAKMPSFYLDLLNQRGKTEVDYLNGAVVRYGAQKNISTPINQILTDTLLMITDRTIPRNTYLKQVEKFISLFPN